MIALAIVGGLVLPLIAVQRAWAEGTGWELFANYGFPAAVAAFVLLRLEPRVERLTDAVVQLTVQLTRLEARDGNSRQSPES